MRRESILAPTPFGGVFKAVHAPPPFSLELWKIIMGNRFFTRWRNMDLALTSAGVVFVHHAYSWITQSYKKRLHRCSIFIIHGVQDVRFIKALWKLGKYSRINIIIHNDSLRQVRPRCCKVQLTEKVWFDLHIQLLLIIFFAYNIWPQWPRDIVLL